jgi:hypothetical protein
MPATREVNVYGVSWLSAGDFSSSLNAARAALSGGEAASSSTSWTSLAEPADVSHILFLLKSKIGAQMVRPHACDVRGPQADVFARAVIDRTGPAVHVQCTYPRDFTAAVSFVPGQYDVIWYESDGKKGWREVLRASHQITFPIGRPCLLIRSRMQHPPLRAYWSVVEPYLRLGSEDVHGRP